MKTILSLSAGNPLYSLAFKIIDNQKNEFIRGDVMIFLFRLTIITGKEPK